MIYSDLGTWSPATAAHRYAKSVRLPSPWPLGEVGVAMGREPMGMPMSVTHTRGQFSGAADRAAITPTLLDHGGDLESMVIALFARFQRVDVE